MSQMSQAGTVVSLWRYPVKSMQGEEVHKTELAERGLVGDRWYALIDQSDGKVASAKNPRKWPKLFDFQATYTDEPGETIGRVRIMLPDGQKVSSDEDRVHELLSGTVGRQVRLGVRERGQREVVETTYPNPWEPTLEEYWPDMEGLANRDVITDEAMPQGTFFDLAMVHLLTTATLDQLRELYPQGRFEARRFRPNIVIRPQGASGFVENDWVGRTVRIGREVRLQVTGLCPRCVMTTLPQSDLPHDPGILRTAAKHNQVSVGVYAKVLQGGQVGRGDQITVEA